MSRQYIIFVFLFQIIGRGLTSIAQTPSDTLNQIDDLGKQGSWKYYDAQNRIKATGQYLNNQKIGTWKTYKYKSGEAYSIVWTDYSGWRKKPIKKYYDSGTCKYTYRRKFVRWKISSHANGSW
ncbi:MAG: hypothetical protein CL840_08050 [Crocinitomicaceae bacterium]|nr:hypothetical protein [Crocinitomicaceae bacterium]|tara:strand:- start:6109 stop:6477 length:369 start_codon:yes stop_codon:yes gene_type:complete